jgi:flagella basal body P-ring formation protein FlgA
MNILLTLLLAAAPADGSPASAPAATIVKLPARASVRGTELVLGDFAELSGPRAAELSSVPMGFAPSPGRERVVAADAVAQRLAGLGIDRRELRVVGARTTLRVLTQLVPAAELGKRVQDLTRGALPPGAALELRGALADWTFPEAREASKPTELQIAGEVKDIRGDGSLEIRALSGGEILGSVSVPVRVKYSAEVLVAAVALQRGDAADPARFEKKAMDVTHVQGDTIADVSVLTGRILARPLAKNAILTAADLAKAPIYRKGDQTRIVITRGALRIEALVRVDADASAGGTVPVTCLEFGKSLVARVRDDGTLTLDAEERK